MLLYQFNRIYYKTIGEYENGIRIIFISDAEDHLLVYDSGCFHLVNKPARINLDGYVQRSLDSIRSPSFKQPENYSVQQISEHAKDSCVYIKLEDAIIKIAMYFYTGDGQMVEDFVISNQKYEPETYRQLLQEMEAARPLEIIDLRFT